MKSRIKKLLAAALALCLIAALVPGAAFAVGEVATVNQNGTVKGFNTLEEAIETAHGSNKEDNRNVTLNSDYTLSSNCTLDSDVTLTIDSDATLTIAPGVIFTVNGQLTLNGSIEVAAGNLPSAGGSVSFDRAFTGGGSIDVGASGSVTLASGQTISGRLTTAGTVTAQGEITVSGSATVSSGGSMSSGALKVTGSVTNSGTVSASDGITVNGSGSFTHNAGSGSNISGNLSIYGTLEVRGTYTQASNITVQSGGTMSVSGDYTALTLTVNGTLNITGGEFNAGNSFTVGSGAEINVSGSAELTVAGVPADGTISVSSGSTLNVGNIEMIGRDSLSGDVEVTKESTTTVITVSNATVNEAYTISSTNVEKLVVDGTLTMNAGLTIESSGELVVDGTLTVGSNQSLTVKNTDGISGSGRINVSGWLYNENNSGAGDVDIQIQGNGLVYSKSAELLDNVHNGTPTTTKAPNGTDYELALSRGTGGTFNVKVVAGDHGSVSTTNFTATAGDDVRINATPDDGYMVDTANTYYVIAGGGRSDSVNVNGNVCTFNMPNNDVTVYIGFTEEQEQTDTVTQGNITVTTSHNGHGSVTPTINGRTVTIRVTPDNNYVVSRVVINNDSQAISSNGIYTYTASGTGDATVNVSVTFESDKFTVTTTNSSSRDGDVYVGTSGYANSGEFQEGKTVYIHAVPDSRDYALRTLYVYNTTTRQYIDYYEASGYDDVYYFTMPESNVNVWGYFTDGIYEITKDIDGNGSLAIRDENGNTTDVAEEGEEIRIYPSADKGYRLGDIYVTYTDSDDEDQTIYPEAEYNSRDVLQYYWFEMPEYDVEIYADFGEGDYVAWIDRSDMKNGTIRVSPNVADEDDTVSIYVTPDTGYQLDELIVEDEDGHDVTTTSLASGTRYTFRMPDSDVTVTATFKSRSYSSNFTDVPRYEWYYEAVSYVASEGLMNGVSTTQFNPNGTASRAQIVTILWRLAGEPSALTGAFTDVPAGQYYSTAVAWASRQGIVTGVGNNRFEPNSNITREQLAVILYRYAQDAGYTTSASANITGYYDYARVNSYARTAMSWAVGAGLITGTSTTTLSPQDTATRAQVATILMRFCENIAK